MVTFGEPLGHVITLRGQILVSPIFPSKVQNLTVFSMISLIRIRLFGTRELIPRRFSDAQYMRTGLLRMGMLLARVWRGQAVGISPTERLKLRRQMAAAAGKKESVFLSLYGGE